MEVVQVQEQKHFVLVHGACLGAWIWYKLKPRLESAGHRVTVLDLSASGLNPKRLEELRTIEDYSLPLMETMAEVPLNEKVILVGHSLGGLNLALAMDRYPQKISAAIFLSAFLPDTMHGPSYVLDEVHLYIYMCVCILLLPYVLQHILLNFNLEILANKINDLQKVLRKLY